jgi:hypothetical protein
MPPKKYQSLDNDPDSDEEVKMEEKEETPVSENVKIPRKYKNNYLVEPEKVVEAIKEGKVALTNRQVRKLITKPPREKRVLSDEHKARLAEQLKRGRETIAKNKLLHGDTARQELLKRKEALIAEKTIPLQKPPKGRPKNMKPLVEKTDQKEEKLPEPEPEPEPAPAPVKKFGRRHMMPSSDTEDGDSTDTTQIKRVRRKIKMVKEAVEPVVAPKPNYANLSLVEKLLAKM